MASERITSSVTTPPALRRTWASPSSRPSAEDVEPRIHAGDDRQLPRRGDITVFDAVPAGEGSVVRHELVDDAHANEDYRRERGPAWVSRANLRTLRVVPASIRQLLGAVPSGRD